MTFDLISGLHMQIQTWHPPLWLCTHAKYYVKSGLTNVLKNANKTKYMHLFSIRIANYLALFQSTTANKIDSEHTRDYKRLLPVWGAEILRVTVKRIDVFSNSYVDF